MPSMMNRLHHHHVATRHPPSLTTTTADFSFLASPPMLRLNTCSREETTRAQLQQQRLSEEFHHDYAVVVSQKIPGLKTSAAFFASLRTNLHLSASPPSSPMSTPPSSMRSSSSATLLPPPSPSPLATPGADQDDVPELHSYMTHTADEKAAALDLIAASVAQMRQAANSALLLHPLNLTIFVAVAATLARCLYTRGHDAFTIGSTCLGLVMLALVACRYATRGYSWAAEAVDAAWLGNADVIVTRFGEEIIGAVVIEWVSGESRQRRKKAWRGEIKAWAVGLKYRGKGVGAALLDDAVRESRRKGAEGMEFADDHANSLRVLPNFYNGKFDKVERKSRELLQDRLETSPSRARKRRPGSR